MPGEKLTSREKRRYGKQIMIPEIGIAGQEKLKNASVLVVGAGGLGCPVLLYLTAAGVGKIGIVEFDVVDETNLQRQILYGSRDLGKLKSIIAKDRLEEINPLITLKVINLKLDNTNSTDIFRDYDVIVDATDNLKARYAINDACILMKKPMVHGAIYKFEGQVTVFNYKGGPDYRKYNPELQGDASKNPQPSDVGLMGVLPGITGMYMANEVIKLITETGTILNGNLLIFNTLHNSFKILKIN